MYIILSLLVGCGVTAIGITLTSKYRKRKNFYCYLLDFVTYINSNIQFSKTNLNNLINDYSTKNQSDIEILLTKYTETLKNHNYNYTEILNQFNFLTNDEKLSISRFLSSFGKLDYDSQMQEIKTFYNFCQLKFNESDNKNETEGKLYNKLSIMIGIAVAIIIL